MSHQRTILRLYVVSAVIFAEIFFDHIEELIGEAQLIDYIYAIDEKMQSLEKSCLDRPLHNVVNCKTGVLRKKINH